MTRNYIYAALLYAFTMAVTPAIAGQPQQEKIGRGVVAVKTDEGVFVSWRYLGTDSPSAGFNLYRDGEKLNDEPIMTSTNYVDKEGTSGSVYVVKRVDYGKETDSSEETGVWDKFYRKIKLQRPPSGVTPPYSVTNGDDKEDYPNGQPYSYLPNSCSVGDVDGDGKYEIVIKWDPTNLRDNSLYGITGEVYLDCYKFDGTQLWRINLGKNIRAGAHYTQFMVYDLDGDGKAEVACKTAPGTIDGKGKAVLMGNDSADADYRNSRGMVITGSEYLTVFNGETGAEITSVPYSPLRGSVSSWGNDSYGNRSERYLACIAYLDGIRPSLVMCRGYYQRTALAAYNFDGKELTQLWLHDSTKSGEGAYGQGNHNLSVGDVDEDGCDEIVYGACVIDNDGSLLYRTGLGHGDAIHLTDFDPDLPGLELFTPHEETTAKYGFDLHRAGTGEIIYGEYTGKDVGRAGAGDIDPNYRGVESWTSEGGVRDCKGTNIGGSRPAMNFRVYWDGDLQDELLDNTTISKWNPEKKKASSILELTSFEKVTTCNSTKATPCLQADLFGDWREEIILWDRSDSATLVLFTTTTPTQYRIPTLMHDHVYRMGIAWQNVAYNQPPHLGYYIGDGEIEYARLTKVGQGARNQTLGIHTPIDTITFRWDRCDGVELNTSLPGGITSKYNESDHTISIFGTPTVSGTYTIYLSTYGNPVSNPTETITFEIIPEEEITAVARYPFDETAGTTAANTIYGQAAAEGFTPEWSTGHSGNAITFPATAAETSRLTQASYPELAGLSDNPFTIALWIKAEKADQNLLNIEGDNGSYIRIEMNKTFSFSISDGTETTKAALRSTTLFNNEWNQLICIRDREDGKLYLYINGERKANISDKCGDLEISRITIGNRTEGDTHLPFRGMLDELVISTGAMNERQVEEYYQKTSAGITETAASSHEDPVQVYPTRFTDQLQLRFKNTDSRRTNIVLYNNAGTAVFEREYNTQGLPRLVISGLEALPKGSYTLTISQDGKPLPAKKLFKW